MLSLIIISLALLIYGLVVSAIGRACSVNRHAMAISAARASDREQWASLDY